MAFEGKKVHNQGISDTNNVLEIICLHFLKQFRSGRFLPLSKKLLPTQEGWKMKNDFQLLGNNFLNG